eukprot:SAG11_NODE_28982_length_315_cov_1.902778_1_plen_52_part_10
MAPKKLLLAALPLSTLADSVVVLVDPTSIGKNYHLGGKTYVHRMLGESSARE